jgi:hypothetical protein
LTVKQTLLKHMVTIQDGIRPSVVEWDRQSPPHGLLGSPPADICVLLLSLHTVPGLVLGTTQCGTDGMLFQRLGYKRHCVFCLSVPWIFYSDWCSCHILWTGPCDEAMRPLTHSQWERSLLPTTTWKGVETDPPVLSKPPEDCSPSCHLNRDSESELPTKVTTPTSYLCKIVSKMLF